MAGVRKMGKYVVGETLGEGGFSKVRMGKHEDTGELVALKIIRKDKGDWRASNEAAVQREIDAMLKLSHPNVLRLIHVDMNAVYQKKNGTRVNAILLVVEFAKGGELFPYISMTGSFEEALARTYFQQSVHVLDYCHKMGLAHRDLKLENIMLDESFNVKVAAVLEAAAVDGARDCFPQ